MTDLDSCCRFLQRLIQTESLPGEEGDIAALVLSELNSLGFVDVHCDAVGNVLARAPGTGSAPGVIFNTHLDHVDVGDPSRWPHPPFAGHREGGLVYGRGAVDIKGPLAAQVYGISALLAEPGPGDVWVTAAVQEEIGGVGARHLAPTLAALCRVDNNDRPLVVVGEPSSNQVRNGHRGRIELQVSFLGRSAHASAPSRAINPLLPLGVFLSSLEDLELTDHLVLGRSTLAPTLLHTDQSSANVIPAEVHQTLDVRTVPDQDLDALRTEITQLARAAVDSIDQAKTGQSASEKYRFTVTVPTYPRTTYTGLDRPIPASNPPYFLEPDHPSIKAAVRVVEDMGGAKGSAPWKFATDGGHFAAAGAIPIGFGPGNERLAHTVDEHIEVAELEQAVSINASLGRTLAGAPRQL